MYPQKELTKRDFSTNLQVLKDIAPLEHTEYKNGIGVVDRVDDLNICHKITNLLKEMILWIYVNIEVHLNELITSVQISPTGDKT